MDQPEELALERIGTEMTSILVAQPETTPTIAESDIAPQSTPMPQLAIASVSQEFPATPVTVQTLLLLTSTLMLDKTTSPAVFEPHQSFVNHSHRTEKIPSEEPSSAEVPLNAMEVQTDLLLANQHTIMANQVELQAHQYRLDKRMDKIKYILLQILKTL